MRKLKRVKKLKRNIDQRRALLRNLAYSLIMNGRIVTTTPKAKALKSYLEKLVTMAKKQTLASYRGLLKKIPHKSAHKLFYDLALKAKDRKGGYLRVVKSPIKKTNASQMSIIEWVES